MTFIVASFAMAGSVSLTGGIYAYGSGFGPARPFLAGFV
jgi:hypothetical protein